MAAQIPASSRVTAPPGWALACVPGLAGGARAERIERLHGGTVNEVYRVDSSAGRFVLRIDGPAWRRPGVDRARELALHRTAAAAGLAPAIVGSTDLPGVLVTQYLDGRVWQSGDFDDARSLRRLGERLYALHQLPPPALAAFDPWQVATAYVQCIDPARVSLPEAPLRRLRDLSAELAGQGTAAVVHGDLWQGNVLDGSQLWLLDWEYAQLTDPLMDVACVLAYYPLAERHRGELAAAAGFDALAVGPALSARVFVYRALAWLWHLARGESAEPPSGTGIRMPPPAH
jgi:aminoglycoside phosphotransferase (APT) family kinase protein